MSLMIDLSLEFVRQLQEEAARKGQAPEEFARTAVEEKLATVAAVQLERNQGLPGLLRRWREEAPDLEEAEGYPTEITPLSLREISGT
jgi:hypothetical protein